MKLIIAGGRDLYITTDIIAELLNIFIHYTKRESGLEIVTGKCPTGVDAAAEELVHYSSYYTVKGFPADWNKYGKSAGPIRNKQMAEYSDALLVIWDGESRGSKNMKEEMLKLNKPVYEVILKRHN